jgi:hypothetical protein
VAVNAPDDTPRDLTLYLRYAPAPRDQERNVVFFLTRIDVVEFQHHRIALPAVDARVRAKIVEDEGTIASVVPLPSKRPSGVVKLLVGNIVMPAIERQAGLTI